MLLEDGGLSEKVIGCAINVHKALGPGLLESIYEEALVIELAYADIRFQRQVKLPVLYRGELLANEFKLDLLVENSLVLELKCVEAIIPIHEAQLLTYMRLGGWHFGLLINFKTTLLKHGIKRLVLDIPSGEDLFH